MPLERHPQNVRARDQQKHYARRRDVSSHCALTVLSASPGKKFAFVVPSSIQRAVLMSTSSVTLCGRKLDHPGHICAFFDSRQQEYDVLTPYYKEGIEIGEEVVTIVDAERYNDHCRQMRSRGVEVESAMQSNRLKVLTAEDTYTAGGRFEATRMYELLQGALADAKARGRRVRTSGVMDWSAKGTPGTEELIEYEAKVNVLVPIYECTLLCVYDLAKISGQEMMDILTTHPYVVHRRRIIENPHYVPPIEVLKDMLLDSPLGGQSTHLPLT